MKKAFIIIGFITAVLAVILSVSPLSNLAIPPIFIAFISGLLVFFISRKKKRKTKTIQYIFLLVIMALSVTIYKSVIHSSEIGDIENLEQRDEKSLEDSKKILESMKVDENV